MFLTSLLLLVASLVLMVVGAFRGSTLLLVVALGFAVGGAACLGVAMLLARLALTREGLGPQPSQPTSKVPDRSGVIGAEPVVGYDDMDEEEIVRLVGANALRREQVAHLLAYEAAHRTRPTVLEAAEAALRAPVAAASGARPSKG